MLSRRVVEDDGPPEFEGGSCIATESKSEDEGAASLEALRPRLVAISVVVAVAGRVGRNGAEKEEL